MNQLGVFQSVVLRVWVQLLTIDIALQSIHNLLLILLRAFTDFTPCHLVVVVDGALGNDFKVTELVTPSLRPGLDSA